ncbi:hypothetical protein KC19_1G195600 [Ceratodon purpureus]|uniref:ER membrane protein complex subunit 7 beta-sandwich domain-containing protein n=1 Tax=Ceratodon purpureus TaxID=3225 RepID=A0A8T0J9X4_CERPU|nr:hypothetical protein KC19_1G195600 [Ceratodon purpureus]
MTGSKPFSKASNAKVILNGGEQVSLIGTDGWFAFERVPAGTQLVEVATALGYFFPPVRVDVSSRLRGEVRASYVEKPDRRISNSLVLEPLREENYYEIRTGIMDLLKSRMFLRIGFSIVSIVVFPMLA